ncbi:MAG: hypothetical protein MJ202_02060 [Lentisphaeria bacterium]|nr:hypothetical protein [Lentisphaeria bacterium]
MKNFFFFLFLFFLVDFFCATDCSHAEASGNGSLVFIHDHSKEGCCGEQISSKVIDISSTMVLSSVAECLRNSEYVRVVDIAGGIRYYISATINPTSLTGGDHDGSGNGKAYGCFFLEYGFRNMQAYIIDELNNNLGNGCLQHKKE